MGHFPNNCSGERVPAIYYLRSSFLSAFAEELTPDKREVSLEPANLL